jgi:8-oxo-dGTP pyrophosphatase MutT (NUDIX family)
MRKSGADLPLLHHFLNLAVRLRRLIWRLLNPVTVGVRLLFVQDGRVLLVLHTYDEGWWCLPGGGVQAGETLEQAARREAAEELGGQPGVLCLEGIFTNFREGKSDHVAVFSCMDFKISGKKNLEIASWQFFDPSALPTNTFSGHRRRIEEYNQLERKLRTGLW